MQKYLAEKQKPKAKVIDHTAHGKQTVGKLMEQNTELTNIEINDQNIKSFERVAKKYNIDFALKKDKAADPPRYVVFFKARDAKVVDIAFKEFMAQSLVKFNKPSLRKKLTHNHHQPMNLMLHTLIQMQMLMSMLQKKMIYLPKNEWFHCINLF